jgi:SNF2 family DNA or RNA helicase
MFVYTKTMNDKSQINISFKEESLTVTFNGEKVEDPLVLERINSIIGDEKKEFDCNVESEKYTPLNPAAFTNKIDNYFLLQRSKSQRISYYFTVNPDTVPELYNYQKFGVTWLKKELPLKILADDMGIGKTAQAITALNDLTKEGIISNTLIVAPGPLIGNWLKELMIWAPNLLVSVGTPSSEIRESAWNIILGNNHVYLTTYDQIKLLPDSVLNFSFDLIVADEAQNLKSPNTDMYKSIKKMKKDNLWLLTGTPVENSKSDLINLLTLSQNSGVILEDKKLSEREIRSLSKQYILRRNKADILSDLPALHEKKEFLSLNSYQEAGYKKILKEYKTGISKMNPLQVLTELRKVCDFDSETNSSSKVDKTIELVKSALRKNEKVVIFSFKVSPLDLLNEKLKPITKPLLYTGKLSKEDREDVIKEFKTSKKANVLLASIQLAGVGLTLVEANNVVFFNEWWNPSVNLQARDRVNRIGQKREVYITSFVIKDTIDERLQNILKEKKAVFDGVVEKLNDKFDYDTLFNNLDKSELEELIFYGQ